MVMRNDDHYPDEADNGYRDDPGYYGGRDHEEAAPRRRGLTSAVVVLVGLGAFGGIIAYAYNQGMRAGTETVAPVLRADTSPTKVRPEQPGGLQVPHQDKLVYERLNPATATGGGRVERLLPPPEAPVDRPRPMAEEELPPEEMEEGTTSGLPSEEEALSQFRADQPMADMADELPPEEPVEQPVATQAPTALTAEPQPAPVQSQAAAPPAPRPAEPTAAKPEPVKPEPPKPEPAKPEPAKPATSGKARVQVGAVDAEAKAKAEWARLQKLYPSELGGLSLTVQKVDLGAKGVFHRLQGSGLSEAEAEKICAALKAKGAGCIVIR